MGEVSLLAQEKQNQVRFCCIDICRKRRLSSSESILHMLFTRGFSKNKHTYIFSPSQPLKRLGLCNLQGHSVWPRTKGSRSQFALDMHWTILCANTTNTNSEHLEWGEEKMQHRLSLEQNPSVFPTGYLLLSGCKYKAITMGLMTNI